MLGRLGPNRAKFRRFGKMLGRCLARIGQHMAELFGNLWATAELAGIAGGSLYGCVTSTCWVTRFVFAMRAHDAVMGKDRSGASRRKPPH